MQHLYTLSLLWKIDLTGYTLTREHTDGTPGPGDRDVSPGWPAPCPSIEKEK